MTVKISSQIENKLLNRKELLVNAENAGSTIKSEEIQGKVAALLNVDKNLVVVETVHQYFGMKKSQAQVKVYDSLEFLQKTEPKSKAKKEAGATAPAQAQPAAAPAAAAAQPAAKPAEAKKS